MLGDFFSTAIFICEMHVLRFRAAWLISLATLLMVGGVAYAFLLSPPHGFPTGTLIVITRGETSLEIAQQFGTEHLVRQPLLLRLLVRIGGNSQIVHAGVYRFDTPLSVFGIAGRLLRGETGVPATRVTFTEGQTARDMSQTVAKVFPEITASDFLVAAEPYEGYLFPDTYVFQPDATANMVVARLRATFDTRIASVTPGIDASGHSIADIVTMASIIEKEGRGLEEKRIISGILWNRIALHMPLQVDAVFGYINSRRTYSPSFEDLAVDSPYNTYTHRGLPPGPISNPGLNSLYAAANPSKTKYLYYLTGNDGQMHYAVTFTEHNANRIQYLN